MKPLPLPEKWEKWDKYPMSGRFRNGFICASLGIDWQAMAFVVLVPLAMIAYLVREWCRAD